MKKVISFLIPIVITCIMTSVLNVTLDKQISQLQNRRDISYIGKKYGDIVKDRSSLIKNILSEKNDLFLLGSSEMGVDVPENALKLFPIKDENYDLSCFGRAYCQDLQQATYLAGADIKEKQKVTLILSLEWFENKNSIKASNFAVNFSDMQFYKLLENPKITDDDKEYYAKRVYECLSEAKKYPAEALYANLYYNKSLPNKFIKLVLNPYYGIKKYLLNIKDKALIYKELKSIKSTDRQYPREIDWKGLEESIQEEKEKFQSTNQFHLEDKYYNQHKDEILKNKDISKDEDLLNSKEMNDYKFFLNTCKSLNIEPYIVLLPVNGWYYDYLGLPKDKRFEYYDKVTEIAREYNCDVLDFRDKEYEDGFLIDTMHFGREGWLRVSEGIYKHFNKK